MQGTNLNRIQVTIIFITFSFQLKALPDGPFPVDTVYNKNIKTVQLFRKGWEFSYPVLELNDNKSLLLSFDDLDDKSKSYNYKVVHCDADWMPSRLSSSEYIEGFDQNTVSNYESSVSTNIPYIHYSIKLPNEHLSLKLSGNYVIFVYEDNNEDNPVLVKRFVIEEPFVQINANIRRSILPNYQNTSQEVNFTVTHSSYPIDNPDQSIKVVVVKNNNWRTSVTGLKPMIINNTDIVYENDEKNIFPGGNEYRSFDIKDLKYQSANIQSINFINNSYQVDLKPDKPRNHTGYFFNEDLNGKYLIQNKQGSTPNTDAEYVHVNLTLSMDEPVDDGDVYVTGGFSDYLCYEDNRMTYNSGRKAYEADLLVKQGYYNYQYVLQTKETHVLDEGYFEGNYYETENEYAIFVYYCPYGSRYDHLVGIKVINSLKNK